MLFQIPSAISSRPFWPYGRGNHSSEVRAIIGAIVLKAQKPEDVPVDITNLVLEGSSQWVLGKNVTDRCDIANIGESSLLLPGAEASIFRVTMTGQDMNLYIHQYTFGPSDVLTATTVITRSFTTANENRLSPESAIIGENGAQNIDYHTHDTAEDNSPM